MKHYILYVLTFLFSITSAISQQVETGKDSGTHFVAEEGSLSPGLVTSESQSTKVSYESLLSIYADSIIKDNRSPYKTSLWTDGAIITAGVGLTALGVSLIGKKDGLTLAELATKTRDDVPGFDRGNAGYYSEQADKDSYIPFHAGFVLPVAMALVNGNERKKLGQVMVLYLQTMAITGSLFTMATGNIYRERPYVYGNKAPENKRLENDARRSFYAGHTAATAAATFFTAKAFSDFNPGSKARPYVWGVAAAMPAVVGYLRYKAGMHFLSDNILGYILGAGAGIMIPELHKNKKLKNLTLIPEAGNNYKGVSLTYKLFQDQ